MGIFDFLRSSKSPNQAPDQITDNKQNTRHNHSESHSENKGNEMNLTGKKFNIEYCGKTIVLEIDKFARQADGTAFLTCGGTQVLSTVCSATQVNEGQDFFPLLVDYREKFYSAGKFLGGYLKREGRPSTDEILLMRMIDRPFRPLFPKNYLYETIVQSSVLSFDEQNDPEVLAGLASSLALGVSDIPFAGPVGFCKVAQDSEGNVVFNPSVTQWEESKLKLVVAATKDAILMVEGEAQEVPEEIFLDYIFKAHTQIISFCEQVEKIFAELNIQKRPAPEVVVCEAQENFLKQVKELIQEKVNSCLEVADKIERQRTIKGAKEEVIAAVSEKLSDYALDADAPYASWIKEGFEDCLKVTMRSHILNQEKRIGNRGICEVRSIATEVGTLKNVHGSSLFTRGETQVLAAVTMGGKEGIQMHDRLHGLVQDNFYLHYTFPPFSVGEARGYRGAGRREIGHGNLAERALKGVLPEMKDFPYVMRVNCEVLESNGSSSMGSVCSGSLALMDAGVPLSAPVAGVAMGLIIEGEQYKILTDILGDEDHLGDMDFKVAGTEKGVNAIQMDIKVAGISREIFKEALAQARDGRLHILKEMAKTMATGRESLRPSAPRIATMNIAPDKIGELIGPGGKNIKKTQERFEVTLEVDDTGMVKVLGNDDQLMKDCLEYLDLSINGPKVGENYPATVATIKEYGAFVDIAPGVSGLVHISEVAKERVEDVEQYLKEGDSVTVRVVGFDKMGRIKLSIKAALEEAPAQSSEGMEH